MRSPARVSSAGSPSTCRRARPRGSTATSTPPTQTAEKFTGDGRWYLTGDAGRTDEDGDFFFIGPR